MEAVNGSSLGEDKGGPPPPSPLTGCYLLVVIGEPHSEEHKDIILQKVAKGLLSWDANQCLVDLEKELAIIIEQGLEGEEARYGERLIQFASENLVTEILIHPAVSTLSQCVRNLLSSFTRHRHVIHAGYTFQGNGSWALQDGTFSYSDFAEAFQEIEVQRVIHAYENGISIDLHCAAEGDWTRLPKEYFTKACKVRVNPTDVLTTGSPSISGFIKYLGPFLVPTALEDILESSDVVGNIRFSRPTLYVFPGGQGDAALFGINGFNMLLDGGYSRKACFWDFVRHLDRLDAVLMTRLNNSSVSGVSSVLKRKKQGAVYPQIGHFFCNIQERKSLLSPDGDKDRDPLIVSLLEEGQNIIQDLRYLNLNPQSCYRDQEPIILYHKVGHGTLNMYVLSPDKNSREVKEFLQKWNQSDPKLFAVAKTGKDFAFPLQNMVSICALLVWQPANPNDTITRILYPGSAPQKKIFEGLERIRNLEYLKHPVCTVKSIAPAKKPKTDVIEKLTIKETKLISEKKIEDALKNGEMNGDVVREKHVKKSDSVESEKEKKARIDDGKKPEKTDETKIVENGEKPRAKPKNEEPKPKTRGDNQQLQQRRKPTAEKRGPPTPKKTAENKTNGETRERKAPHKASPHATPAKSTKDANNRKVIENKRAPPSKKETATKPAPAAAAAPEAKPAKTERKPISRRPKAVKGPPSPMKKMANGVQKVDSLPKRGKLDKEGTTDSSTVSTPSADQESILKKDISKLTPEEIRQLKDKELEELKEEQEAVKEIEAVFRKGEAQTEESEPGVRKIKEMSIDDNLDTEEYLIIEKEEIEHDSLDQEAKEGEMQKLVRDSEESEKRRKPSAEEEPLKAKKTPEPDDKTNGQNVTATKLVSPEDKPISADKKETAEEDVKEIVESHPEEKVSANIESGATTTAPTLPEDERITLDEIKEDNGQAIEEKHVKEETKEKEIPIIQLPPKSQQQDKQPQVVGIPLEKQKHIRDIVKTPDEVADLPVHEEADYQEYHGDEKKSNDVAVKDDKKDETDVKVAENVDKETVATPEVAKRAALAEEKPVAPKPDEILEKAEVETKEKTDQEDHHFQEGKLKESIDEEWVVITKDDEEHGKAEEATKSIAKADDGEFALVQSKEENPQPPKVDKQDEPVTPPKILEETNTDKDIDTESEQDTHEIRKEDEIEEIIEKDKEDIKALIEEADRKSLEDFIIEKEDAEEPPEAVDDKMIAIKESKQEIAAIDTKLQQLKKDLTIPVEELELAEEPPKMDLKQELQQIAKIDDKLTELKSVSTEEPLASKDEITVEKSTRSPEHAESVVLSDSSPEEDSSHILKDLDIDKSELGRKSPAEREEDVKKIVVSVAEVLKSEAPLEDFQSKLSFTQELRETHITTQDSPILEAKIIKTDDIPPIPEEPAEEDAKPTVTDKEPSPAPTDADKDDDAGTVHRMLVTASSEDGGEEIEICPVGTITFSKSSESSGRSSPEPSQKTQSQKSSTVDTLSETLSTVKRMSEEDSVIEAATEEIEKAAKGKEAKIEDKPIDKAAAAEKEQPKTKVFEEIKDDSAKVDDKTKEAVDTAKHEDVKAEHAQKVIDDKVTEKIEAEKPKDESAEKLVEDKPAEKAVKDEEARKKPVEEEKDEDIAHKILEKVEASPKTAIPAEIEEFEKVSEDKSPKVQKDEVTKHKPEDESTEDQKTLEKTEDASETVTDLTVKDQKEAPQAAGKQIIDKVSLDQKEAEKTEDISKPSADLARKDEQIEKPADEKDLSGDQKKLIEDEAAPEEQKRSETPVEVPQDLTSKHEVVEIAPKDQKYLAKEEIIEKPSDAKFASEDEKIPEKIELFGKPTEDITNADQKASEKVELKTDVVLEDTRVEAADKLAEVKVDSEVKKASEKIADLSKTEGELTEKSTVEDKVISDQIEEVSRTQAVLAKEKGFDEKSRSEKIADITEKPSKAKEERNYSGNIEGVGTALIIEEQAKASTEEQKPSEETGEPSDAKITGKEQEDVRKLSTELKIKDEPLVKPSEAKEPSEKVAETMGKPSETKTPLEDRKTPEKSEAPSKAMPTEPLIKDESVVKPPEAAKSEKVISEAKDVKIEDKNLTEDQKISEKSEEIARDDEAEKPVEGKAVPETQKASEKIEGFSKVVSEDKEASEKVGDVSEAPKDEWVKKPFATDDQKASEKSEEIAKDDEAEMPVENRAVPKAQKLSEKVGDVSEAPKDEWVKKPAEDKIPTEDQKVSEKFEEIAKGDEAEKPVESKTVPEAQKTSEKVEDISKLVSASEKVGDVFEAPKDELVKKPAEDKIPTEDQKVSEKFEEIGRADEAEMPVEGKAVPETQKASEIIEGFSKLVSASEKVGDVSEPKDELVKKPAEDEILTQDQKASEKSEEVVKGDEAEMLVEGKTVPEAQKASEKVEDISKVVSEDKEASERVGDVSEAPKDEWIKTPAKDKVPTEDQKASEKFEEVAKADENALEKAEEAKRAEKVDSVIKDETTAKPIEVETKVDLEKHETVADKVDQQMTKDEAKAGGEQEKDLGKPDSQKESVSEKPSEIKEDLAIQKDLGKDEAVSEKALESSAPADKITVPAADKGSQKTVGEEKLDPVKKLIGGTVEREMEQKLVEDEKVVENGKSETVAKTAELAEGETRLQTEEKAMENQKGAKVEKIKAVGKIPESPEGATTVEAEEKLPKDETVSAIEKTEAMEEDTRIEAEEKPVEHKEAPTTEKELILEGETKKEQEATKDKYEPFEKPVEDKVASIVQKEPIEAEAKSFEKSSETDEAKNDLAELQSVITSTVEERSEAKKKDAEDALFKKTFEGEDKEDKKCIEVTEAKIAEAKKKGELVAEKPTEGLMEVSKREEDKSPEIDPKKDVQHFTPKDDEVKTELHEKEEEEEQPKRRDSLINKAQEFIEKSEEAFQDVLTSIGIKKEPDSGKISPETAQEGDKKQDSPRRRSSIVEAAEEFIDKSEKVVESVFTAVGGTAKSVLDSIWADDDDKKESPEQTASDEFKADKDAIEKEKKQIDEECDQLRRDYADLSKLTETVSFEKCRLPEDYKVDKETVDKEEKEIEERIIHVSESVDKVSDLTESISFDKCQKKDPKKEEEFKLDQETLKKEEKQIEEEADALKRSYEDLSKLTESASFEKCHPPQEYKMDKEVILKEEKAIEDRARHLSESFDEVSHLAKTVSFEKCHLPEDEYKVDKDVAEQEKNEADEEKSAKIKEEIDAHVAHVSDRAEAISELAKSLAFEKCPLPPPELKPDAKLDEAKSSACTCSAHLSRDMKEEEAVRVETKDDHHALASQSEKCEKESMEKTCCPIEDPAGLKVDHADQKKLSVSDVEISIKTDFDHKDAIQSFLDNERSAVCDTTDAKVFRPSPEDFGASTVVLKTPTEGGPSSDKSSPEVELSGKTTPPTVPISPVAKEPKSPSSKLDSGLSEQTETDEDDLSTKSQIAHSQSDLDELDAKMDPMSMSFYGALPEEQPEVAPTYLYEITRAKYGSAIRIDEDLGATKEDEMSLMTASFIGELPSSSTSRSTPQQEKPEKDAVDSWGKPLSLPAPTYLYEVTQARFSSSKSAEVDLMTSSFIGEELPTSRSEREPDPMTTSVYFGDSPDPIASWGKPLGLPSPAPPNNNEKGTPKKEKKLPAYVSAKNKLNDDKKRSESPSKMRAKKVNPVYVDLTYVPHHGNHNYSYVDFFKKIRARYYVFSGLEPSRQVYDALLEAKQTWEDKELEVTIIPTYDTDILGYWVAENEELLTRFKIDLAPSASRCTINLQDHETSCSAYRLEF